jgi:hypothetical protein
MAKQIYRPDSTVEADFLRGILREQGIQSSLENDNTSQWRYRSVTAPLAITVADGDELRATNILQEHFDRLQKKPNGPIGSFEQAVMSHRESRKRLLIVFIVLTVGILLGVVLLYYLLAGGVSASIRRMQAATDAKTEAEAFQYTWRHTKGYGLRVLDKDGNSIDMRTNWLERNVVALRINWREESHTHRIFDTKNVLILMRE